MSIRRFTVLEDVRQVAQQRHLSLRSEEGYLHSITAFIDFHQRRHPERLGVPEIHAYLRHLAVECQVAASTQNVALCALRFLYREASTSSFPPSNRLRPYGSNAPTAPAPRRFAVPEA